MQKNIGVRVLLNQIQTNHVILDVAIDSQIFSSFVPFIAFTLINT